MHKWSGKCVLLAAVIASSLASAAPVVAAETHVFNAELSLTGNCSTSSADTVPDPGCPGGLHPPSGGFLAVPNVATDEFGNLFVLSGANGIDIFDSKGFYVGTVGAGRAADGQAIAVDSDGRIYVFET